MASLSDLKRRIRTVKNTGKITKAMSLISASQTNKIKNTISDFEHYQVLIKQILAQIVSGNQERFDEPPSVSEDIIIESCKKYLYQDIHYIYQSTNKRQLLIVMTADKGLCGAFNSSIAKHVIATANAETDIMCIGKKGYELLSKKPEHQYKILENHYIEVNLKKVHSDIVMGMVTTKVLELIASNIYSKVKIIYTKFITMLKQQVDEKQIFPLLINNEEEVEKIAFDSKPISMLHTIIPYYINAEIYDKLLQSFRSETAKRMVAMDNASSNSNEMFNDLTLEYNRKRQTKVTSELIEVISGMQE